MATQKDVVFFMSKKFVCVENHRYGARAVEARAYAKVNIMGFVYSKIMHFSGTRFDSTAAVRQNTYFYYKKAPF